MKVGQTSTGDGYRSLARLLRLPLPQYAIILWPWPLVVVLCCSCLPSSTNGDCMILLFVCPPSPSLAPGEAAVLTWQASLTPPGRPSHGY